MRDELSQLHRVLMRSMLALPAPIVAAVHGPAVGFGAELVALCDLVVIGRDAFLSDPHVHHGLPASPGCQLVWPHLTSRSVAKELLLSGRRVDAEEALRLGLVNRVVPPGRRAHRRARARRGARRAARVGRDRDRSGRSTSR